MSTFVEDLGAVAVAGRPFFALFHTYQVHSPYLPPAGYGEIFGSFEGRIRPTSDALKPIASTAGAVLERTDFDYLISQYDGEIRFLDDQLRVLFDRLHSAGLLENAVVLITSDHGEEFGDHGGVLHRGTLFDELVRVPFIVWGRDIPAAVVDPALVSTIDIAPTLLSIAGVSPPAAMEGRNVLDPATTPWRDQRVFAQYGTAVYSIRTPGLKLIRYGNGRTMLFDLIADPRERRNLAAADPDLTAVLDAELEAWRNARPRLGDDTGAVTELDPSTEERLRALGYLD